MAARVVGVFLVVLAIRAALEYVLDADMRRMWFAVALLVGAIVWYVIAKWRNPDRNPLNGATPRRELGLPYRVEISRNALFGGANWEMRCSDDEMMLGPASIRLADVRAVRVRPVAIHIDAEHEGRPVSFAVKPCACADRERMLWELAVRVPDAVERGIDLEASKSAEAAPSARPAGSRATLPATGPARTGPAAAAPATLDARAAMSNFDAGMDGLGSALAAPASRPSAPPKSGLGCGLFVAEPKDDDAPDRARPAPR